MLIEGGVVEFGGDAPFPIVPDYQDVMIGYKNEDMIADFILPRKTVNRQVFTHEKQTFDERFRIPITAVGRKSRPNQVEFTSSRVQLETIDHALDDPVPQSDIDNATGLNAVDPRATATEGIADLIALDREKRVADLVTATGNYAASNSTTLSGSDQWSDDSSDPTKAILGYMDGIVMRPKIGVCGQAVATKLRTHPQLIQAWNKNSGTGGAVPLDFIAMLWGLDKIYVGQAWAVTSKVKADGTYTSGRLWGKHFALLRINPLGGPGSKVATYGYTAQFGPKIAGVIPDPNVGMRGGQVVRAGESVLEVVAASDMGFLIANAVA